MRFSDEPSWYERKWRPAKFLGTNPKTGFPVYVMFGPFGPHVQLGVLDEDGKNPKRVSVLKHLDARQITLETALSLLSLPRELGNHSETGKPVKASVGRIGPYVIHERVFRSIPKSLDVLTIDLTTAVELLKQPRK